MSKYEGKIAPAQKINKEQNKKNKFSCVSELKSGERDQNKSKIANLSPNAHLTTSDLAYDSFSLKALVIDWEKNTPRKNMPERTEGNGF